MKQKLATLFVCLTAVLPCAANDRSDGNSSAATVQTVTAQIPLDKAISGAGAPFWGSGWPCPPSSPEVRGA